MSTTPFFQAGLPQSTNDVGGIYARYGFSKGVVRGIDPDRWRVDIEAERGGLLLSALVIGDVLPPIHHDTTCPSHVVFTQMEGNIQDLICWPLPFRRFFGKETQDDGKDRHFYDRNRQIVRIGNITIRATEDDKIYLYDSEENDYFLYDMKTRTMHAITPHIFLGTDEGNRAELHTDTSDDRLRVVIPKAFIGSTAIQDQDGLSYLAHQLLHLVSDLLVKATAGATVNLHAPTIQIDCNTIVMQPYSGVTIPKMFLGGLSATERLIYGDAWMSFYNAFVTLFNGHSHGNVQNGPGTTGAPVTPTSAMPATLLSPNAKVL